MHSFAKRAASFILAGALAFTGLAGMAGCSMQPEPTSAKEVVERYSANEKHNNYHTDGTVSMEASVFGQSMTAAIDMTSDTANNNTHTIMKINALGMEDETEAYTEKTDDKIVQYSASGTGADRSWSKSALDTASMNDALTSSSVLNDGEFKKVENGYEITVSGSKIMEALESGNMDLSQIFGDMNDATFKDALQKSSAVYTFDKDCLLTNVAYELPYTVSYGDTATTSSSSSSDSLALSAEINIKLSLTMSNYGGVDAASVAVPEDVKSNAIDTDAALEEVSSLIDGLSGDTSSSTSSSSSSSSASSTSSSTSSSSSSSSASSTSSSAQPAAAA